MVNREKGAPKEPETEHNQPRQKSRKHLHQVTAVKEVGREPQFQHHDGDDDGDDAIAERLDPPCTRWFVRFGGQGAPPTGSASDFMMGASRETCRYSSPPRPFGTRASPR